MKKADLLSTLFVGIDVSSRENVVCALDFEQQKRLQFSVPNNQPGAVKMAEKLQQFFSVNRDVNQLVVALESTSFYGVHIANYLSSCETLMPFSTHVYCINPKLVANYKKSYVGLGKTDAIDAFIIADFARVGRITSAPWRGSQFLALQRLTRHRLHLARSLTREKTYMLSNIFLKFSEFSILDKDEQPFSNNYGAAIDIACDNKEKALELSVTKNPIRDERAILTGCYVIETTHTELSACDTWHQYMMLSHVEAAFRDMKSDLGVRPVYHQKAERTAAHLFITVLAYHLLVSIEHELRAHRDFREWRTIRTLLSTHNRSTVVMTGEDKTIYHIRVSGTPEAEQSAIYKMLSIKDPLKSSVITKGKRK